MQSQKIQLSTAEEGLVEFSFGSTEVKMSVDAAYDFQYRLAEFIARLELAEDRKVQEKAALTQCQCDSHLESLMAFQPGELNKPFH